MPGLLGPHSDAVHQALANGNAVALALVCLLQYVYSLLRISRVRNLASQYQEQVDTLSLEMLQLDRERMVHRLENQILRDVLTQTDCRKALAILLKRFVPNSDDGFAAFVMSDIGADPAVHVRGLASESVDALVLSDEIRDQLRTDGTIIWETPTPLACPLIRDLQPADRKKARFLAAVACQDEQGMLGAIITTTLLPLAAARTDQIELTTRLMQAIAPGLRQTLELEQQTTQLQCTREMLELRAITDTRFDQPIRMIEAFLTRLCDMVQGDAVRLFLLTRNGLEELRTMFRYGTPQQAGLLDTWMEHEERLARCGNVSACLLAYDRPQLLQVGVTSLIGSAMTAPVIQDGLVIGVVCITRRSPERPSAPQRQLLTWSAEALSYTIHRAINLVAIERQARQDGLTELSNRRTFDAQLAREFVSVRNGALSGLSLLLLDLDRFKAINDVYGHPAGDEVLRSAARVLRDVQAKMLGADRSTAARYGGEELAMILPGVDLARAIEIAEAFRTTLERHVIVHLGVSLCVTVSVGVATFPIHGHDAPELIASADAALYLAKTNGRNRVECGPPEAVLHYVH